MVWLNLQIVIGQNVLHMKRLIWLKVRYMNHIIIYLKTNEYNELNEIAFKQMVDRLSGIYEIK